jgi:Lar family restriction alleviation protein
MNKPCIECAHSAQAGPALLCNHPDASRHASGTANGAWIFRKFGKCTTDGELFVQRTLACPFCGGRDPAIDEVAHRTFVLVCEGCGAMGPFDPNVPQTAADATKAWNARGDHHAA